MTRNAQQSSMTHVTAIPHLIPAVFTL